MFFNRADLTELQTIFGADRVFDFTGINHFNSHVEHFYDQPHFRPLVADSIMQILKKIKPMR